VRFPRILIPLLGVLAGLALPAAAPAAEVGLNVAGGLASGTPDNFNQLRSSGAKWARHFVYYDDAQLPAIDPLVHGGDRAGVKTLLVIAGANRQAPDADRYADFVGDVAKRFRGRLEAIEIWNEQDEGHFWAGGADPQRYVDLLQRSYTAIKAADPGVKVVFGPTVGNNYSFLEQAYAAGAKGYFDVMAAHTDTACLVDSPMTFGRGADGRISRFNFLGFRELRATMLANSDDKPIWLTEIGWSAAQHPCESGMWAGKKAAGVSEAQQAQFLREAFHCLAADPYVQVAMWFNNRDPNADGRMEHSYGLLRADGSRRPVADAFTDVARNGNTLTGPCGDFGAPKPQILSPTASAVIGPKQALPIKVLTGDNDVLRILLEVKGGGKIRSFTAAGKPLTPGQGLGLDWQGAKRLPYGTHTIVVTAIDAQQNRGTAEITFRKLNPATLGKQATRYTSLRLLGTGRVRTVTGQARARLPFALPGKVLVEWQAKRGGGWKKVHGGAYNANKPFKFKQRLKYGGQWRVRVRYQGKGAFKSSASRWMRFKA
jgi:hypothetical protein